MNYWNTGGRPPESNPDHDNLLVRKVIVFFNHFIFNYLKYHCSSLSWLMKTAPCVYSVVSDSVRARGQKPSRLPCPWDSPSKNTGVGCHALLPGIFPSQGWNLHFLCLLHYRRILSRWDTRAAMEAPCCVLPFFRLRAVYSTPYSTPQGPRETLWSTWYREALG